MSVTTSVIVDSEVCMVATTSHYEINNYINRSNFQTLIYYVNHYHRCTNHYQY